MQHLLQKQANEVNDLLQNHKANFYVCGDASNMAREVSTVLISIIAQERGIGEKEAEEVVRGMRASGSYQEDVWS